MVELVVLGPVQLALPASWERASEASLVAPRRSFADLPTLSELRGFQPNVYIQLSALTGPARLDDLVETAAIARRGALPQLRMLDQRERTVAGAPAVEHVFTFEAPPTAVPVQQAQVLFLTGATACTLTFTSLPGFFEEDRRQFDDLLDSVQLREEAAR